MSHTNMLAIGAIRRASCGAALICSRRCVGTAAPTSKYAAFPSSRRAKVKSQPLLSPSSTAASASGTATDMIGKSNPAAPESGVKAGPSVDLARAQISSLLRNMASSESSANPIAPPPATLPMPTAALPTSFTPHDDDKAHSTALRTVRAVRRAAARSIAAAATADVIESPSAAAANNYRIPSLLDASAASLTEIVPADFFSTTVPASAPASAPLVEKPFDVHASASAPHVAPAARSASATREFSTPSSLADSVSLVEHTVSAFLVPKSASRVVPKATSKATAVSMSNTSSPTASTAQSHKATAPSVATSSTRLRTPKNNASVARLESFTAAATLPASTAAAAVAAVAPDFSFWSVFEAEVDHSVSNLPVCKTTANSVTAVHETLQAPPTLYESPFNERFEPESVSTASAGDVVSPVELAQPNTPASQAVEVSAPSAVISPTPVAPTEVDNHRVVRNASDTQHDECERITVPSSLAGVVFEEQRAMMTHKPATTAHKNHSSNFDDETCSSARTIASFQEPASVSSSSSSLSSSLSSSSSSSSSSISLGSIMPANPPLQLQRAKQVTAAAATVAVVGDQVDINKRGHDEVDDGTSLRVVEWRMGDPEFGAATVAEQSAAAARVMAEKQEQADSSGRRVAENLRNMDLSDEVALHNNITNRGRRRMARLLLRRESPETTPEELKRMSAPERRKYESTMKLLESIDSATPLMVATGSDPHARAAPHHCPGCGATLQTRAPRQPGYMAPDRMRRLVDAKNEARRARLASSERELLLLHAHSVRPDAASATSFAASATSAAGGDADAVSSGVPADGIGAPAAAATDDAVLPPAEANDDLSALSAEQRAEVEAVMALESMPHVGLLQSGSGAAVGTVTRRKHVVCNRCHNLTHYSGIGGEAPTMDAADFRALLRHEFERRGGERHVLIKVADVFDFDGSFVRDLPALTGGGGNPIVLALNKCDLLPPDVKLPRIRDWAARRARELGVPVADVVLVSGAAGTNVRALLESAARLAAQRHPDASIYVVGSANVGKSTLVNKLIAEKLLLSTNRGQRPVFDPLTVSPRPGTTLGIAPFALAPSLLSASAARGTLVFDTPGVSAPTHVWNRLSVAELKAVLPADRLRPVAYRLGAGSSLLLGGMVRIDVLEGLPFFLTVFCAPAVTVHLTEAYKAGAVLAKHTGGLLTPPFEASRAVGADAPLRVPDAPNAHFDIQGAGWMQAACDLVLPGLGWVSFTGCGALRVAVHACIGVEPGMRAPSLLPFETRRASRAFTGPRKHRY